MNVKALVDAIHHLINSSPRSPTKDQLTEVVIAHAPDMPAAQGSMFTGTLIWGPTGSNVIFNNGSMTPTTTNAVDDGA